MLVWLCDIPDRRLQHQHFRVVHESVQRYQMGGSVLGISKFLRRMLPNYADNEHPIHIDVSEAMNG